MADDKEKKVEIPKPDIKPMPVAEIIVDGPVNVTCSPNATVRRQ